MTYRMLMAAGALLLCGCQSMQLGMLEKMGHPKREVLVDRVGKARDTQREAQQQFKDALEQFGSVVKYEGGDLEAKYKELDSILQRSEAKANDVHQRIRNVDAVAEALFKEWRQELGQYNSDALRKESEQKWKQTRARYDELMVAMRKAEKTMEPVLRPLRDQVLYLKHNLNARALSAIQSELNRVESDVSSLVKEMNRAIAEADKFIAAMQAE